MPQDNIRELPNKLRIRSDGAVLIPADIMAILGWQVNDDLAMSLNLTAGAVTYSRKTESSKSEEAN